MPVDHALLETLRANVGRLVVLRQRSLAGRRFWVLGEPVAHGFRDAAGSWCAYRRDVPGEVTSWCVKVREFRKHRHRWLGLDDVEAAEVVG